VLLDEVEPPTRPPINDTPTGRLFALPAVDVVSIRSLAATGEKLHLAADGTVVPFREVRLATEVDGKIIEKSPLCEAGKYVKAGHVLMKIDPTDYELTVKRLQRQRQQEYEGLGEVDQEMVNVKRSMELARADIELQQREVKRRESLPNQFASQGELDQARRAVLNAEQQLVLLQNQFELAKKKRARLESAEQLAALQLEAAETNLARTEIIAPIDGVIVTENAELNTYVGRGSPVVTMEDTSKVEVAAKLRAEQLYWVLNQKKSAGNELATAAESARSAGGRGYRLPPTPVTVRYTVSGREGLVFQWSGRLSGYDGIGIDEQTRTVPVRIVVDDPRAFQIIRDGKTVKSTEELGDVAGPTTLVRGMFVNLRLELDPAVELMVLPSEALKPGNRIWEFVPNPSVLDVSILPKVDQKEQANTNEEPSSEPEDVPPEQTIAAADVADAVNAANEAITEKLANDPMAGFNPQDWVPGDLVILQNIRPVDRFTTAAEFIDAEAGDDTQPAATPQPDGEMAAGKSWICEVPPGSLTDGSYVVVSPMGSLRSDVFPVRAASDVVSADNTAEVTSR
jgi:multidrug efflux pump subunit AcrA (membrane-fusion protein)